MERPLSRQQPRGTVDGTPPEMAGPRHQFRRSSWNTHLRAVRLVPPVHQENAARATPPFRT
eukprot:11397571-Alexandrium_andersonii.AAC.1